MPQEPKLELKARPIEGTPDYYHLFFVYTDENGKRRIASAGPERFGRLFGEADDADKVERDRKHVDAPLAREIAVGIDAKEKWQKIEKYAEKYKREEKGNPPLPHYVLFGQNSNSFAAGAAKASGLDITKALPEGVTPQMVPGVNNPIEDPNNPPVPEHYFAPPVPFPELQREGASNEPARPDRAGGAGNDALLAEADGLIGSDDYYGSESKQARVTAIFRRLHPSPDEESLSPEEEPLAPSESPRPMEDADVLPEDLEAEIGELMAADDYWRNPRKQRRAAAIFKRLYPGQHRTAPLDFGEGV